MRMYYFLAVLSFSLLALAREEHASLVSVFCHGAGGSKKHATHYEQHKITPPCAVHSFNFCDRALGSFNKKACALGQAADIDVLRDTLVQLEQRNVVLIGVSRGAATIINYMGIHQPSNINALVFESPFSAIDDVLKERYTWLPMRLKRLIFKYFVYPAFDFNGEQPTHFITKISKDIPVAFICIEDDAIVPCHSTVQLYEALKNAGHEKCHLFKLSAGIHARIVDDINYRTFIHAFYAHYGLPHDTHLAQVGEVYFASSRP